MKVLPFQIPKSKNVSLIYQEDKGTILYDKLHQHEEIQLGAILKGEGSIVVGDSINEYKSGDILIIGAGNSKADAILATYAAAISILKI